MNKWNLIVDVALCNNCNNCVIATKDEYIGNTFPGYSAPQNAAGDSVVTLERKVRGSAPMVDTVYVPKLCQHCDDAPCIKATGNDGSIRKREDGIVIVDPVKSKGRRDLVNTCPYGAIVWNEKEQVAQNWIFDAHLLDQGWKEPRCAQACPTRVFETVKTSDASIAARAKAEGLEQLRPELNTKPRVLYKNLHRYNRCFIGGTVSAMTREGVDCVYDATVTLLKDGAAIGNIKTDEFGDFKFEKLAMNGGAYTVEIAHPQFGTKQVAATLGNDSLFLGEIRLN